MNAHVYHDQWLTDEFARAWRLVYGLGAGCGLCLVIIVVLAFKSRPLPYVAEVTHAGAIVGIARPALAAASFNEPIKEKILDDVITDAFKFDADDFDSNKNRLTELYGTYLAGQAQAQLLSFYTRDDHAYDPLVAYRHQWQAVRIESTLKAPEADSYDVVFSTERHHSPDSSAQTTIVKRWRAELKVEEIRPTDANPTGLYVRTFDVGPLAQ